MRYSAIGREYEVLRNLISKTPKKGTQSTISLSLLSELTRIIKLMDEILHKSECAVKGKGSCSGSSTERYCHTGCYNYRVVERSGEIILYRSTDEPFVVSIKPGLLRIATRNYGLEFSETKVKLKLNKEAREVLIDLSNRDSIISNIHFFKSVLPDVLRELEIANANLSTCLRLSAIACV